MSAWQLALQSLTTPKIYVTQFTGCIKNEQIENPLNFIKEKKQIASATS